MRLINIIRQTVVYVQQYFLFLRSEGFVKIFMFPIVAAILNIWITGENMYKGYSATETACFVFVCEAIWCAMFHSILVIVKERKNVGRDYIAGVNLEAYVLSRTVVEFVVCAIQSVFFTLSFVVISKVYGNSMPDSGLVNNGVLADIYCTMLLILFSADALGILISCFAKTEVAASQVAPYFLMIELILSGFLFELTGVLDVSSKLMVSRWGTEGLSTVLGLENYVEAAMFKNPLNFEYTAEHLKQIWYVLLAFSVGEVILGDIFLHSVKNDRL